MKYCFVIFAAVCSMPIAATAQPAIVSGRLGSATIDVTKPRASPSITLNIMGTAGNIVVQWQSPSGLQGSEAFYSSSCGQQGPGFTGTVLLQGYSALLCGNGGVLSLYSEQGTWTLTNLSVCGFSGNCTSYNGTALSALFPRITFDVANPGTPDTTPPVASSGTVLTPTVSIKDGPAPAVAVRATDNLSGVYYVQVNASTPGYGSFLSFVSTLPTRPILNGSFKATTSLPPSATPGTYTINSATLIDIAGNASTVSDPAAISKLFGNKASFTVTN